MTTVSKRGSKGWTVALALLAAACTTPSPTECSLPSELSFAALPEVQPRRQLLVEGAGWEVVEPPSSGVFAILVGQAGVTVELQATELKLVEDVVHLRRGKCAGSVALRADLRRGRATVTPAAVDFGPVALGETATRTLTIEAEDDLFEPKAVEVDGASAFVVSGLAAAGPLRWTAVVDFRPEGVETVRAVLALNGVGRVPLAGSGFDPLASSCLTLTPQELDLGIVEVTCRSTERTVQMSNDCLEPVTVALAEVSDGGWLFATDISSLSTPLAPGARRNVRLRAIPLDEGRYEGALVFQARRSALAWKLRLPVRLEARDGGEVEDSFRTPAAFRQDLLFVVHPSPWVVAQRDVLLGNFQLDSSCLAGTRVAVASDVPGADRGRLQSSDGGPGWFTTGGRDAGGTLRALAPARPVDAGSSCLETALAVLDGGAGFPENLGFPQAAAPLTVVCVSDRSVALSRATAAGLADGLRRASPFTQLLGLDLDGCDAGVDPALEVVLDAGGVERLPLCRGPVGWLCFRRPGVALTYHLTQVPLSSAALTVLIDRVPLPRVGALGEEAWAFDATSNSVTFSPAYAPPPGATVVLRYRAACL